MSDNNVKVAVVVTEVNVIYTLM